MSVLVWDGKTLAADRQGSAGDLKFETRKIWKTDEGEVIGIVGSLRYGSALVQWYVDGASPDDYPIDPDSDTNFTTMVVAKPDGTVWSYENCPYPLESVASYDAWGSGAEAAYAALSMGADAIRAVEAVSKHSRSCGFGVDFYEVVTEAK